MYIVFYIQKSQKKFRKMREELQNYRGYNPLFKAVRSGKRTGSLCFVSGDQLKSSNENSAQLFCMKYNEHFMRWQRWIQKIQRQTNQSLSLRKYSR